MKIILTESQLSCIILREQSVEMPSGWKPESEMTNDRNILLFTDSIYGNDENYKRLKSEFLNYFHSGKRDSLNYILSNLSKYPILFQANEMMKPTFKTLYRGIGFGDPEAEGEEAEICSEYMKEMSEPTGGLVAATKYKTTAQDFAAGRGHLDYGQPSRNKCQFVIVYRVTPASIVLDGTIFGSIYGEGEIIIDDTKSTILEVATYDDWDERWNYEGENPTDIIGYRGITSLPHGMHGTWYYQEGDKYRFGDSKYIDPKKWVKKHLHFENPLIIPQSEIDEGEYNEYVSQILIDRLLPNVDVKPRTADDVANDFIDMEYSRMLMKKVKSMGYDGVIYGDQEIVDYRS